MLSKISKGLAKGVKGQQVSASHELTPTYRVWYALLDVLEVKTSKKQVWAKTHMQVTISKFKFNICI